MEKERPGAIRERIACIQSGLHLTVFPFSPLLRTVGSKKKLGCQGCHELDLSRDGDVVVRLF